jgi:hypothetical protein
MRALLLLASVVLIIGHSVASPDVTYKFRRTIINGVTHDEVFYLKAGKQRIDRQSFVGGQTRESFIYGPHGASVSDCNGLRLMLNLDSKLYFVVPPVQMNAATGSHRAVLMPTPTADAPRSTTEVHLEETGKHRKFYGHEAWLVRETRHTKTEYKGKLMESAIVTDTWYIEPLPTGCPEHGGKVVISLPGSSETRTGTARIGLPIERTQHVTNSDGSSREFKEEIVEWSEAPLSDDLFAAPADFKETKDWNAIEPELGKPNVLQRMMAWFYRAFH